MNCVLKNFLKSFKAWVFQSSPRAQSIVEGQKNPGGKAARFLGVNPPVEIRPSLNKGLGVFARRPIPRASIIMRDRLVLRFKQGEKLQQIYRRFERLPRPIQDEVLKLAVLQDVERSTAVGIKLLLDGVGEDVIPKVMHLADVLSTNAFEIIIDHPQSPGGLFLTASHMNHSCVPNADRFYGDELAWKSFVANRDITEGEEITVSYIDHTRPRTERQRKLRNWAIDCQCPGCDINHPESRAHEDHIKHIARHYEELRMAQSGRLEAGKSRPRNKLEHAAVWSRKRIKLFSEYSSFHKYLRQA